MKVRRPACSLKIAPSARTGACAQTAAAGQGRTSLPPGSTSTTPPFPTTPAPSSAVPSTTTTGRPAFSTAPLQAMPTTAVQAAAPSGSRVRFAWSTTFLPTTSVRVTGANPTGSMILTSCRRRPVSVCFMARPWTGRAMSCMRAWQTVRTIRFLPGVPRHKSWERTARSWARQQFTSPIWPDWELRQPASFPFAR